MHPSADTDQRVNFLGMLAALVVGGHVDGPEVLRVLGHRILGHSVRCAGIHYQRGCQRIRPCPAFWWPPNLLTKTIRMDTARSNSSPLELRER